MVIFLKITRLKRQMGYGKPIQIFTRRWLKRVWRLMSKRCLLINREAQSCLIMVIIFGKWRVLRALIMHSIFLDLYQLILGLYFVKEKGLFVGLHYQVIQKIFTAQIS